jgi:hypothetical protein
MQSEVYRCFQERYYLYHQFGYQPTSMIQVNHLLVPVSCLPLCRPKFETGFLRLVLHLLLASCLFLAWFTLRL